MTAIITTIVDKRKQKNDRGGGRHVALTGSQTTSIRPDGDADIRQEPATMSSRSDGRGKRRRSTLMGTGLLVSSMFLPYAAAASCISLANSTTCSAFKGAKISTSNALTDNFEFLKFVSNTSDFDSGFLKYTKEGYVTRKYGLTFGCENLTASLPDTSEYYARYTTTVLCSRMVQDSKQECGPGDTTPPVCADTCAQFAKSEQMIVLNPATCSKSNNEATDIIRSDFTICSLPSNSLDVSCILGSDNEIDNCGFRDNLLGLCLYCAESKTYSTDTCCYSSGAPSKCAGLVLPTFSNLPPVDTATSTPTPTPSASPSNAAVGSVKRSGLSGGAIAGITIGTLVAVGALVFALLFFWRRKRYSRRSQSSIFNHPIRSPPSMTFTTVGPVQSGHYEVLGGGRVARMSALEESSSQVDVAMTPTTPHISRAIIGSRAIVGNSSSSDFGLESSPGSRRDLSLQHRPLHPPPRGRNASLSSASMLTSPGARTNSEKSPGSVGGFSNPTSEQLPYFKDYYSSEDIHPGDAVSVLWAYTPRAPDEFELERGDMLKIVGIWDDGWATGIFLPDRAEDVVRRRELRDSGISASQSSHRQRPSSRQSQAQSQQQQSPPLPPPPPEGTEIRAFPLVCVCLPDHWQKTVENEVQGRQIVEYDSSTSTSKSKSSAGGSGGRRKRAEDSTGRGRR